MENKEEILEGNKRLATYLGYVYHPFDSSKKDLLWGWWNKELPDSARHRNSKVIGVAFAYLGRTHKDLKFYNDWNLLLRVYTKLKGNVSYYSPYTSELELLKTELGWQLNQANRHEFFKALVSTIEYVTKNKEV